ncbi:hypothetical protein [Burkholderia territorii]|uniref:hypothetical protein n=1 Tax=Burkholderia territorii TaxID=1503055 RepID=UPI001E4322E3|nr:hypothetical protein [Burkholderia territorii]
MNARIATSHSARSWPRIGEAAGVIRAKQRGKKRGEVIEQIGITPPLAALLDRLEVIRGDRGYLYVFTPKSGTPYTRDEFKRFWGKLMSEAIGEKGNRRALHVL